MGMPHVSDEMVLNAYLLRINQNDMRTIFGLLNISVNQAVATGVCLCIRSSEKKY